MAHDPLCPELRFGENADRDWPSECQCDLIARVRADEREKALEFCCADTEPDLRKRIAQEIEAQPIDAWGSQEPRGPVTFARREAQLRSARIARGGESDG